MSKIRIKAKAKDGVVEVKLIAKHPMETGLAKDKDGNTIPAHYIEQITAMANGEAVFNSDFGPAVSKNPYLKFFYKGAAGDTLALHWVDNLGEEAQAEVTVK